MINSLPFWIQYFKRKDFTKDKNCCFVNLKLCVHIAELILWGFFFNCALIGAALIGQSFVDFLSSCVIFSLTNFFWSVRTDTVHIIMRCIDFIFCNFWTTTCMAVAFQIFGTISESSGKFLMLETSELYVLYSKLFQILGLHLLLISS